MSSPVSAAVVKSWRSGTVIQSWLLDLLDRFYRSGFSLGCARSALRSLRKAGPTAP